MPKRLKILFLCTGNSCRSQMAEGSARHLLSDSLYIFSAGTEAKGLDPYAIAVMKEVGVDISEQYSKTVSELGRMQFDYVITLCGADQENCPFFLAKYGVIHKGFDDPVKMVAGVTDEQEILKRYRKVRDEIWKYVEALPVLLKREINGSSLGAD
jgi:arsenate reductase